METKRRKLFSTPTRRKLFSAPTITVKCHDCGLEIQTADETTSLCCPKCGGKRFDVPGKVEEKEFSRISLFKTRRKLFSEDNSQSKGLAAGLLERKFSDTPGNEFESLLGTWQGKELEVGYASRLFSDHDLVGEGFAEECGEGKIKVFSMAQEMEKLYSSLKITVIKELCLDPLPSSSPAPIIENLAIEKSLPAKTIVLMKKAHALPKEHIYSEVQEWVNDSGIKEDLEQEFGGRDFTENELKDILEERYEDAPEHTVEYLKESGVIEETPEGNLHIKK